MFLNGGELNDDAEGERGVHIVAHAKCRDRSRGEDRTAGEGSGACCGEAGVEVGRWDCGGGDSVGRGLPLGCCEERGRLGHPAGCRFCIARSMPDGLTDSQCQCQSRLMRNRGAEGDPVGRCYPGGVSFMSENHWS